MSDGQTPDEMRRMADRLAEIEEERNSIEARYEFVKKRLEVVARSSRDFTRLARETMSGQHGLENELRTNLARRHEEWRETEESRRWMEDLISRLGGVVWEAEVSEKGVVERLTFVGGRSEEILGYPRSRWLRSPKGWFDAMHPEDRARVKRAYARAVRENEEVRVEFRVFAASGRMVWIQDLIRPDENGARGARLRGLMVDVTERKRAEEGLREWEEKLRAFVGATSDIVYEMSADWREMRSLEGKEFIATTESPREDWTEEYIPEVEKPRVWAAIERAIKTRSNFELEHRVVRVDGTIGWTFSRAIPLKDEAGEVVKWFGAASDITERKRREANQALLAEISGELVTLDSIPDAMERLGEKIGRHFGVRQCVFSEVVEFETAVASDGWNAEGAPSLRGTYRMRDFLTDEQLAAHNAGEILIVSDTATDPRVSAETYGALGIRSFVVAPLAHDHRWRFLLSIIDDKPRQWRDDEIDLMRDLTMRIWSRLERARAEEAMRESEERLSLALGAARMGNWSLDLATGEASRSALHDRIFGYEEMLPEWTLDVFLDHVHPDDRPSVAGAFERSSESGERWEFECRIIRADGETRWIWALGNVESGDNNRMFGLVNDITERKDAEEKVRRSEERFRFLFEQATDAAFVHDLEGRISQANERACESLGYSREELLTMNVSDIETNLAPGRFEEMWKKVSEGGEAVLIEGVHRRKDDSTFPVEVNIGRFEDDGEPSLLALARDVTERKRVESERESALARERSARGQMSFLAETSRQLASFLELDEALSRTARLAVPRVAEWCVVDVLDAGGHNHRLAVSFVSENGEATVRLDDRPDDEAPEPVREVIRTGEPFLVERVDDEHLEDIATDEEHLERLRSFGLDSYAIAPLIARARTFGTITFARNDPEKRYDEESLSLLGNFADRAALALENSRLYEKQRHTAEVLQRSLLPDALPEIPGLDIAARFEPLGEDIEVGGDFYDIFPASEGRWSVAIGDVLGKGPEAAAVTALARHTIRNEARREEIPSRALEALNAAMLDQPRESGKFCTVLFGNIRPSDPGFEIEFASGGHPLPFVLREDGSVEEAGRHGTLLGVYDDPELFDSKASLAPGDAIVLYTDGVTESRREGELFGEERVKEAIASCVGCDAHKIADALEERLHEFSGGTLDDDAAILVVKVVK